MHASADKGGSWRWAWTTGLVFAAACLLCRATASSYDPHVPNFYDPYFRSWFEGWYIRVTPDHVETSGADLPLLTGVGLILGAMPRGRLGWNISLASLMIQEEGQVPLRVLDDTGLQLSSWTGEGDPVTADPDSDSPPNFTVSSDDGRALLRMQGDSCTLRASLGGMRFEANCTGPPRRWGPDNDTPEGAVERLPTQLVGCHWSVYSLATPLSWRLVDEGTGAEWRGAGTGHFEKNWGATFPERYVWAQGAAGAGACDPGADRACVPGSAAFALAGGKLPLPSVPTVLEPTAFLVGIRTPGGRDWSFRPWDPSVVDLQVDGCAGELNMTASAPLLGHRALITMRAAPQTLTPITCPTYDGFLPRKSVQAWTAEVTIELYEDEGGWWQRLWGANAASAPAEVLRFTHAAVEFGGAFQCQSDGNEWVASL